MHESPFATLVAQEETQQSIDVLYKPYLTGAASFDSYQSVLLYPSHSRRVFLDREKHITFALNGLEQLPKGFVSFDANLPWLCYWNLNSLDLLGETLSDSLVARTIQTLRECQHPKGGFGGGPNQLPHLASTFAAISAVAVLGTKEAYDMIDRKGLNAFLTRMKQENGAFTMHDDGETCCRGLYCAIASASLTGLLDDSFQESGKFVASSQTYEGGIGACPFAEAHAGYSYCGFAALCLLGQQKLIDLSKLEMFARRSQCPLSGAFKGRSNKLVDGCYSFWTGALFPLIRSVVPETKPFDSLGLQKYILVCAQNHETGGLRDKPEEKPDFYHTCYCLGGLALAQQEPDAQILGVETNKLKTVDPLHNLLLEKTTRMKRYFESN